ncbi:MAG TPA: VWA domain-containing protein [Spirochaetota bacterium]|nr:VWA domain-containing protein [Spirochaetota bacterium]
MERLLKFFMVVTFVSVLSVITACDLEGLKAIVGNYEDVYDEFKQIADQTGGKIIEAEDAEDVPEQIVQVIKQYAQGQIEAEIMLLIDKTGSMEDDIDAVVEGLNLIIDELPDNARLGLATYGDKNVDGSEWFSFVDLTSDHDTIKGELDKIETTGGGDWRESVFDGIYETIDRATWWDSAPLRLVICIGDAAPLTGSDTTYSLDDVVTKSKELDPAVNVFMIAIKN